MESGRHLGCASEALCKTTVWYFVFLCGVGAKIMRESLSSPDWLDTVLTFEQMLFLSHQRKQRGGEFERVVIASE